MTALATAEKQALLTRLEAMQIEPEGAERTFVRRLGQENGWTASFAERVVNEYRRFLYLAATADHPVTPSNAVDQAWHLHLAYTRHYWEELCGRILGRPLHHGPTAGGSAEAKRYRDQYAATLESYRAAFGVLPPEDIWPSVAARFGARYQWVDRRTNWVIPKMPWRLALAAMFFAGCAIGSDQTAASNTLMLFAGLLLVAGVAIIYVSRRDRREREDGAGASGGDAGGGGGGSSKQTDDSATDDGGSGCGGDGGGGCGGGCGGCGG